MPIYMDVHIVPGVKARDVAEAHRKDLLHQDEYNCKCMTYWIDEKRESIFCLIDAPDKECVSTMHKRAHGLVPNKVIEVSNSVVESFLGRIYDPSDAEVTDDGLKIFHDPSFRILVIIKIDDPVLLQHKLGNEEVSEIFNCHNHIIRKNAAEFGGTEVEHAGDDFIISFTSASKAVSCALAIQHDMVDVHDIGFKIAINGGEPLGKTNRLFGDTIQFAEHICHVAKPAQVAISSSVKELVSKDYFQKKTDCLVAISPQDENFLSELFGKLEEHSKDTEFDVADYCRSLALSTSQLYRKCVSLTGLSPNLLLKEFRLEKAKEMMKKQRYSISQITFDSGFSSPSYFTKCFKKKYDMLPMAYLDLLHLNP